MIHSLSLLAALALAGVAGGGCTGGGGGAPAPGSAAGAARPARRYPVATQLARAEPLVYRFDAIGELEAVEWVQVAAQVEGVLGAPAFVEGDRVDPAKVLVEIEPDRYRLVLERQEGALARTEAAVREKAQTLKNRLDLRGREKGWVPDEELLKLEADLAAARAAAREATAQRDLARRDVDLSHVRAPIEGVIERREAAVGQYVRPGAVLATIVRTKPIRVRFSLREEEAAEVAPGTRVSFTVPAYSGETFPGEVFFVARSVDPRTRRLDVIAKNPNDDERLKPGYFTRVTVETGSRADAILLPEPAVLATEEGFVAFVVEDGKARKRAIEIGLQTKDGRYEVKRGVRAGEEVIVRGAGTVQDGVDVAVERAPAEEPAPKTDGAAAQGGGT